MITQTLSILVALQVGPLFPTKPAKHYLPPKKHLITHVAFNLVERDTDFDDDNESDDTKIGDTDSNDTESEDSDA